MQFNVKDEHGLSFYDRSISIILGFKVVPGKNKPGACFVGNHQRVSKARDRLRIDIPLNLTAGTNIPFVKTNIIEQQHASGVKSTLLRIIDSERTTSNGTLEVTSRTAHKEFTELQFKTPITSRIEEFQIELVSITGQKVPFTGTGRVALTLKLRKF